MLEDWNTGRLGGRIGNDLFKTDRIPSQPIIPRFHQSIISVESFTGRAIEIWLPQNGTGPALRTGISKLH